MCETLESITGTTKTTNLPKNKAFLESIAEGVHGLPVHAMLFLEGT
jgi:hypothetical protein